AVLCRWVAVFFLQAEDGIGDWSVTGVQTCALPICDRLIDDNQRADGNRLAEVVANVLAGAEPVGDVVDPHLGRQRDADIVEADRSEERRVGKGWRCWWEAGQCRRNIVDE